MIVEAFSSTLEGTAASVSPEIKGIFMIGTEGFSHLGMLYEYHGHIDITCIFLLN